MTGGLWRAALNEDRRKKGEETIQKILQTEVEDQTERSVLRVDREIDSVTEVRRAISAKCVMTAVDLGGQEVRFARQQYMSMFLIYDVAMVAVVSGARLTLVALDVVWWKLHSMVVISRVRFSALGRGHSVTPS